MNKVKNLIVEKFGPERFSIYDDFAKKAMVGHKRNCVCECQLCRFILVILKKNISNYSEKKILLENEYKLLAGKIGHSNAGDCHCVVCRILLVIL